jgi:hypothetical protein
MKKNTVFCTIAILAIMSNFATAQELNKISGQETPKTNQISENTSSATEKIETQKELQGDRAIFFIVNDKLVSREEYLDYQQKMMEKSDNNK